VTTEALTRVDRSEFAHYRDTVAALDARVRASAGHEALGDAVWRDFAHPRADSAGFLVDDRAYVHVARGDRADDDSWSAALVVPPGPADPLLVRALLDAAVAHAARGGARRVTSWVFGADESTDDAFARAGFRADRTLHEMRVALPLAVRARWPDGISVRTFEPGRDDDAWLRVNNAAFAGHAEQGGWTLATLQAHMADPWFDPSTFLLAFDADGLAGFNWLKWHPPSGEDPARGEIYVIGIDPRAQGTGLGRALAIDGLQLVHRRGAPVGMLFVAADNAGARALYTSLGFTVHRTDRAYVHDVEPGRSE
jgi:mycothiol synthase